MEGNVVVFDRANQRIGFAPSNMSHPDVGPCGKKSPRGPGNGYFEACVLEFVNCYPRYAMIQTSFQRENKIKTENRQDILRQKNNKIFHALASILRLLTGTHSYTILRQFSFGFLPLLMRMSFSCSRQSYPSK